MVKPIGAACNLDCKYCYYLSKGDLLDQQPGSRIADDLLEEFIRQYIEGQDGERVVFSWQGGEPTLLGLDFFRKVVALEAKHKRPGQRIENDLQTNGTLLDETWCRFLREHGFLVGLSIDGPRNLHDAYRVTKGGEPTFDKVFAAAKLLRREGVKFNTLTVVNRLNATRPLDVYRFLTREVGSTYVQLIPCVEPADFRTTAPQRWDPAKLPLVGTPRGPPRRAGLGRHRLVGRCRRFRGIPLQGLRRVASQGPGAGAGRFVRVGRGAVDGPACAALHHRPVLRQGGGRGARRQRLLLRPLRLSRASAGQYP